MLSYEKKYLKFFEPKCIFEVLILHTEKPLREGVFNTKKVHVL